MSEHIAGRFENIQASQYHAHDAISSGRLSAPTPAHWLARREKSSDAMTRGNQMHAAILEPELCVVAPVRQCAAVTKSSGAPCRNQAYPGAMHCGVHGGASEAFAFDAEVQAAGKTVVPGDIVDAGRAIIDSVLASDYCWVLESGGHEITYRAWAIVDSGDLPFGYRIVDEPRDGAIPVQCRLDVEHIDRRVIVDLKGVGNRFGGRVSPVDPDRFTRKVFADDLHIQAALYLDIVHAVTGGPWQWRWLAYESEAPFATSLYPPSGETLHYGRLLVGKALRRWAEYYRTGDPWAGWSRREQDPVEMPPWEAARAIETDEEQDDA
jgi:hypothetical protein